MHKNKILCFNYVVTIRKGTGPYVYDDPDNKFYAFAERVREREDLLHVITIPEGCSLHQIVPVETATEAHRSAEIRNKNAKALGCFLYS